MAKGLTKRTKILLGVATLGVGYVIYRVVAKEEPAPKKTNGTSVDDGRLPPAPPQPPPPGGPGQPPPPPSEPGIVVIPGRVVTTAEPAEGWQARLEQFGADALVICQADLSVTSYAEAQACVLGAVFPEAPPWGGGSQGWLPWMFEARQGARDLIQASTVADVGAWGGPGWQFSVWLMFDRYFDACAQASGSDVEQTATCMAQQIWPDDAWPPGDNAGWRTNAYNYLRGRVSQRVYGPPVNS